MTTNEGQAKRPRGRPKTAGPKVIKIKVSLTAVDAAELRKLDLSPSRAIARLLRKLASSEPEG